eukprot:4352580-Prymnesium_polylepis.1
MGRPYPRSRLREFQIKISVVPYLCDTVVCGSSKTRETLKCVRVRPSVSECVRVRPVRPVRPAVRPVRPVRPVCPVRPVRPTASDCVRRRQL